MNLSALALRNRSLTLYLIIAIAVAGIWAYLSLGRAEDPPFTIKQMVVQVDWPGASAGQMARSVVDRIERKLEELPWLDYVDSSVQPGHAVMIVSLRDETPPAEVPDLFYQVRKKTGDIAPTLPPGVQGPYFDDEFGDVFGIVYAFTGDGFSLPELRHVVEDVREDLVTVPGVAKITLIGDQQERLYIDFSHRKLAELGLSVPDIMAVVARENAVEAGGFADTPHDRVYVRAANGLSGVEALRAVPIQAGGQRLKLGDIATVSRGRDRSSRRDHAGERQAGGSAGHRHGAGRQYPGPRQAAGGADADHRTDIAAGGGGAADQRPAGGGGPGRRACSRRVSSRPWRSSWWSASCLWVGARDWWWRSACRWCWPARLSA